MGANSAESLPKYARLAAESRGKLEKDAQILVTTKRTKFINPFDPTKVHGELTAFHRRWIHTFPRDRSGLAFQTHHSILCDDTGEGELDSLSTLSPSGANLSLRSFNVGSFGGRSWSDHGQEFRSLRQVGRRNTGASMSSSFGETLVSGSGGRGSAESKGESASVEASKSGRLHSDSDPKSEDVESKQFHSHKSTRAKATPPRGIPRRK